MKKILSFLFVFLLFSSITFSQNTGISLGAQAGIAIPMGDFGDGYKMGFGGQGNFAYKINPMLNVTGSIGYLTWSGKEADFTFSSVPVMVGARYSFGKGKFNPYAAGELGLHFSSFSVPEVVIPGFGTIGGGSASSTDFGIAVGLGFLYQLGPKLDLDVNAKFNNIFREGSSTNFINIMAGVLVAL